MSIAILFQDSLYLKSCYYCRATSICMPLNICGSPVESVETVETILEVKFTLKRMSKS